MFYPWGSERLALIKTDDVLGVTVYNTFFHGIFRVTFLLAARPRELRGPAKSRVKQIRLCREGWSPSERGTEGLWMIIQENKKLVTRKL